MKRRLVVVHPSADLYGSDRQLLESVSAAVECGWDVLVLLPVEGPLTTLIRARGADVRVLKFPVLRKSLLHPARLLRLGFQASVAVIRGASFLRTNRADLLYVNTVTIPWWIFAGRIAKVPVLSHVHEAEADQGRLVAWMLNAPLLAARTVVTNSGAARIEAVRAVHQLESHTVEIVHNGVPGPEGNLELAPHDGPRRLLVVGRLSPRKGTDIAVEATAVLRRRGYDVQLDVAGTPFAGYEWYEQELRHRASLPDLEDQVNFLGYVHPTWGALDRADVVLVPSRTEPFGNVAVEAMLARRPVVASRVQGLKEVISDERTGILVQPEDSEALADAIARFLDDPDLARALAEAGEEDAKSRFSVTGYRNRIADLLTSTTSQ